MFKKKKTSRGKHSTGAETNSFKNVYEQSRPESIEPAPVMSADIGDGLNRMYPNETPAFVTASVDLPKKKSNRSRKFLKVLGMTVAVLCALLAVVYGAGFFVFSGRFMPNTTINEHDVSFKTVEECAPLVDTITSDYSLTVSGQGLSLNLDSNDVGLGIDSSKVLGRALTDMQAWAWPVEFLNEHDVSDYLEATYSTSLVDQEVQSAVDATNETAEPPTNATLFFDETAQHFEISPSKVGTQLDADNTKRVVKEALSSLETKVEVTQDELVQPSVDASHEGLVSARDSANAMLTTNLSLTLDGMQVAALDPATTSQWIVLQDDFTITFNEEAFNAWTEGVIAGCNTVGTERTYTRPDGKVITVSGGSYGWKVDGDVLREQIKTGINSGQTGELVIPVLQSGNGLATLGSQDWGNRYCDIDLSEQYARFYDGNGTLVWEAPIVSGEPNGKDDTPTGVYYINNKQSPTVLIGEKDPKTGEPKYRSPVTFWMPFVSNWVGLHDATWQSAFGGTRYRDGFGSHGCVNLSYSAAESLYGIIQVGDVVVTHW